LIVANNFHAVFNHNKLGILSDAHGNGPAFNRALQILEDMGATAFFFLGDSLGYIPSLSVLDKIVELGERINCVRGNHEEMLLNGSFPREDDFIHQLRTIRSNMNEHHLKEIRTWPKSRLVLAQQQKIMFCHGTPNDPVYGYAYADTVLSGNLHDVAFVFMGNTHRPFVRKESNITFVNVGSCGLPRDNGKLGSVALFDANESRVDILRFSIESETKRAISTVNYVDESVLRVTRRRTTSFFGELV
jgi:putative phosphoesterase